MPDRPAIAPESDDQAGRHRRLRQQLMRERGEKVRTNDDRLINRDALDAIYAAG